jgi:protein SCO1/2
MDTLNHPTRRLALATLLLASGAWLAACDGQLPGGAKKPSFQAVDITGADYANALSLTDPDGQRRTLADFKGKVVVVFFGYTQCPDVCPTTMNELAEVKRSLGADGARVVGVFVTVDPERDTAALLKAYTANFGPDFVGYLISHALSLLNAIVQPTTGDRWALANSSATALPTIAFGV